VHGDARRGELRAVEVRADVDGDLRRRAARRSYDKRADDEDRRPTAHHGTSIADAASKLPRRWSHSPFSTFLRSRRAATPLAFEDFEEAILARALACSFVGSPGEIEEQLRAFLDRTQSDEIIAAGQIFEHAARVRSFEIFADVMRRIGT
jgi:alkanesulfonate monooxygenase SsuD/methylene tetrahydromethanopterin reductase-like flavin-dependent oxidoreductase (luciferase family)